MHKIRHTGAEARVLPESLRDLMPKDLNSFWRYQGSLTTPGAIGGNDCAELVVWTVFKSKITMSKTQLEQFFRLKTSEGAPLKNNFRPTQPLNNREVFLANLTPGRSSFIEANICDYESGKGLCCQGFDDMGQVTEMCGIYDPLDHQQEEIPEQLIDLSEVLSDEDEDLNLMDIQNNLILDSLMLQARLGRLGLARF